MPRPVPSPVLAALACLASVVVAGCSSIGPADPDGGRSPAFPYRLDCSISNWADPCTARASPNESPAKTEVDVAVNPTDPLNLFVASKDLDRTASDCVWSVGQVSKDGGKTWKTTYVGGQAAQRQPGSLFHGWRCITDPILAFNKDGDLFYALQMYRYDPADAPTVTDPVLAQALPPEMGLQLLAVSHDGGETFPETYFLHAGDSGPVVFHDYMRMGANPVTGTVYTIWNQLTGLVVDDACKKAPPAPAPLPASCYLGQSVPVLVAYKPGSRTAEPPVYFPNPDEAAGQRNLTFLSTGESGVVADSKGTVYAWLGGFNSPGKAFFATSTDDGATFSPLRFAFPFTPMAKLANSSYRHGTGVELAVDNSGGARDGCLHAVWGGRENGTVGPSDVYARSSCDGGATWTQPVLVNHERRADGQWMARVSVDGLGNVHAVYATRAYDPGHTLVDFEHAVSLDGGATWTTERLTRVSSDGDKGIHQDGFPFFGDYIGIASAGGTTLMGFPQCFEVCEIGVAVSRHGTEPADVPADG